MFCGTLANKIINKIIKSVFKLEIQIYINHPHPPAKVKGKVQQCVHNTPNSDQIFPVWHTILPPKQKRRLFALFSVYGIPCATSSNPSLLPIVSALLL